MAGAVARRARPRRAVPHAGGIHRHHVPRAERRVPRRQRPAGGFRGALGRRQCRRLPRRRDRRRRLQGDARAQVRKGRLALVLVVPARFGADPSATLKLLADPALPPIQIATFLQRVHGATHGVKSSAPALELEVVGNPRGGRPSSVQQNVPAWLIFGMFLVVMPISALFIAERRDGTLARLVSQRIPFSMLLLGKVGPLFVINLVQAALMLAAGRTLVPWLGGESLALPARWDLLAAVAASTSLAAIGWGLLVAVA